MIFKNATFYNDDFEKETADIEIIDGKIKRIGALEETGRDMKGLTILPGFVDIHIHGSAGGDFSDGDVTSLDKMSAHLSKCGITSFCGTTMTLPFDRLKKIMKTAAAYKGNEAGAKLVGINMEGPYISKEKCGAQNKDYIREGDISEFNTLFDLSGRMIKLITIAPESFDSENFIENASLRTTVSIGHSKANEKETAKAFCLGASHVTHLYNAMTPMHHRDGGIVFTAFTNENVTAELICDGAHVSKTVLQATFKALGENRIAVISDAMRGAGLGEGKYDLGAQTVYVKKDGKYAEMPDGTLAASIANVFDEFKNLLSFGIDFKTALKSCTVNPAKIIGEDDNIGSIKEGKAADFIITDENLNIKEVYVNGILA